MQVDCFVKLLVQASIRDWGKGRGGRIAASGVVDRALLRELLKDRPTQTARLDRLPDLRYDTKRRFVHYVLARLTAWVEMGANNGESDPTDRFLMRRPGDRDFEIEHLALGVALGGHPRGERQPSRG